MFRCEKGICMSKIIDKLWFNILRQGGDGEIRPPHFCVRRHAPGHRNSHPDCFYASHCPFRISHYIKNRCTKVHLLFYGGDGEIRTRGGLLPNWFRVFPPSVTYMVSPVSFSQSCTPANPHEIWIFWRNRPKILRNRPSVPISDFSAFGKNCGKNGKNKNQ